MSVALGRVIALGANMNYSVNEQEWVFIQINVHIV